MANLFSQTLHCFWVWKKKKTSCSEEEGEERKVTVGIFFFFFFVLTILSLLLPLSLSLPLLFGSNPTMTSKAPAFTAARSTATPVGASSSSARPGGRASQPANKVAVSSTTSTQRTSSAATPSQHVPPASSSVGSDRRGTSQLKRSEQTLQEKTKVLEEQLEQAKIRHAEEIRKLQGQLDKHVARIQQEEEQEGEIPSSSLLGLIVD